MNISYNTEGLNENALRLCPHCIDAIRSRGERVIIGNYISDIVGMYCEELEEEEKALFKCEWCEEIDEETAETF